MWHHEPEAMSWHWKPDVLLIFKKKILNLQSMSLSAGQNMTRRISMKEAELTPGFICDWKQNVAAKPQKAAFAEDSPQLGNISSLQWEQNKKPPKASFHFSLALARTEYNNVAHLGSPKGRVWLHSPMESLELKPTLKGLQMGSLEPLSKGREANSLDLWTGMFVLSSDMQGLLWVGVQWDGF